MGLNRAAPARGGMYPYLRRNGIGFLAVLANRSNLALGDGWQNPAIFCGDLAKKITEIWNELDEKQANRLLKYFGFLEI